jgi:hypothetical protein
VLENTKLTENPVAKPNKMAKAEIDKEPVVKPEVPDEDSDKKTPAPSQGREEKNRKDLSYAKTSK